MSVPTRRIIRGMFGKPTLQWLKNNGVASSGLAEWVKEWTRYGEWTAKLTPGAQSGDDYGAVEFTVNNMRLDALKSIRYIYRMGSTEVIAPNVAIHVYDPNDIDNRADITLSHSHDDLGKTQNTWYKFDLLPATDGLFYYGNNIPSSTGLGAHDSDGNPMYTLAEYQADPVFRNYVISKITIEYGYYSTGTIGAAHIAKISVNEEDIELGPGAEELLDLVREAVVLIGSLSVNVIEHHAAGDTLTKEESGSTHTNLGAGAAITLVLPQDALAGCRFRFVVMADSQQLRIDPGAAGAIYIKGAKQTDDKYVWADDIAESVELMADGNGDWVAISETGVWTAEE